MSVADKVLSILARVVESDEVRDDRELQLFEHAVLDSLKTVELMVALAEEFDIEISPAAFEREEWATPNRIVAYMESRVGA